MSPLEGFRRRFSRPSSSDSVEREIESELDFHLDSRVDELVAEGWAPARAREQALREFGDLGETRAHLARIDRRRLDRARRSEGWGTLRADATFALRMLRRSPGFTAVALLTLALGIGANTAIFSAVDSVLLRPLPFANGERLVALWLDGRSGGWTSPATFRAVQGRGGVLEEIAAWSGWSFTLTGEGPAESVPGVRITQNLLPVLGVEPALGRNFLEEETLPGEGPSYAGGRAALLSHGLWQRRFAGDASVVGRTLQIDGMTVPVVGVLPEGFAIPGLEADLWLPVAIGPSESPGWGGYLRMVGRLREGAGREQATAEAHALAATLAAEHPDAFPDGYGAEATALPLRDDLVGPTKRMLLVLLGAVGFVLLVGCANVANLFLARATLRAREMSIRAALGAGRGRLVRQVLTEHVVLAGCGALLGLALAYWGAAYLESALPPNLTAGAEIEVSRRVLGFTLALTLAAGLLSGLAPALRTAAGGVQAPLAGGARGAGPGRERRRLLESLVVAELAVALVLVVGAGLMLQSFWRLSSQDPGFRAEGVLTLRASPPEASYPRAAEREAFTAGVLERLAALPGVTDVGAVHLLPLGGSNWSGPISIESRPLASDQERPTVDWRVATPGYFRTAGIRLLAGRGFTAEDVRGAPAVALVSETLARELFPGEDPLGQRVRTDWEGENWVTVVGVVADVKDLSLADAPRPQMYRPHAQYTLSAMTYMARTEGDPLALARGAREGVAAIDPNVPVSEVQPLPDVLSRSIAQPRLLMILLGGFGAVALLLAALGIYGVIGYAVGQRSREFGVRLALGARPADVVRLVLGGGARLAALGMALGLGGAALLTRFLEGELYEVGPNDPLTFAAVAALLGGVALLGAYVPARRAARVDPRVSMGEG